MLMGLKRDIKLEGGSEACDWRPMKSTEACMYKRPKGKRSTEETYISVLSLPVSTRENVRQISPSTQLSSMVYTGSVHRLVDDSFHVFTRNKEGNKKSVNFA
jgi:hypothetical protein